MSRTDVHVPSWVKERDPLWRHYFKEVHSHDNGICDLDSYLTTQTWSRTGCYITFAWRGRQIHCGCPMCTDQEARKILRRRQRHQARRALRLGFWEDAEVDVRQDAWCSYNVRSRPLDKDVEA